MIPSFCWKELFKVSETRAPTAGQQIGCETPATSPAGGPGPHTGHSETGLMGLGAAPCALFVNGRTALLHRLPEEIVSIFGTLHLIFVDFFWKFLFSRSPPSLGCLSPLMFLALHWSHMPPNSAASSHIADKQSPFGCDHFYTAMIWNNWREMVPILLISEVASEYIKLFFHLILLCC